MSPLPLTVPTDVKRRVSAAVHAGMAHLPEAPAVINRTQPLALPPAGSGLDPVMGDFGYPVVGWVLNWMYQSHVDWHERRREQYGQLSWSGMFMRKALTVSSPDAIGELFANVDGVWSNEQGWDWIIGPFFTRGLMLLDDPDHERDRRIMADAFSRPRLDAYLKRTAALTAAEIDRWGPGDHHAYPLLKQLTLDVATDVFLDETLGRDAAGNRTDLSKEVNAAFIACVRAGTGLVRTDVPGTRWSRGLRGRALLEGYLRAKLPAHRSGGGDDLLTALCHAESEEGETFTDTDIVNHMIFMLMAAHDTTSISVNATLFFLMHHPEWQDRIREESGPEDHLTMTELGRMEALDMVVKEAMRLIPPVPTMGRMALRDTELAGRFIPAGTAALIAPIPVHHDPDLWTNPRTFDPERFNDERREHRSHRHAYIPFGGGGHKCIGMHFGTMEVKTIIHQLLRRHTVSAPDGRVSPWDWTSLPKPLDDLPMTLTPRERPRAAASSGGVPAHVDVLQQADEHP